MALLFSCSTTTTRRTGMNSINRLPNSISASSTIRRRSFIIPCSLPYRSFSTRAYPNLVRNNTFRIQAVSTQQAAPASGGVAPAIALTDDALKHLNKMRSEKSEDLCLRIGVKQGGCSGMSYTMEFESKENTRPDDTVMEYNGFVIVCDPKSLLFIFGMQLDFSDALIGGGFSFKNPNATQTCGCGKSFASEV